MASQLFRGNISIEMEIHKTKIRINDLDSIQQPMKYSVFSLSAFKRIPYGVCVHREWSQERLVSTKLNFTISLLNRSRQEHLKSDPSDGLFNALVPVKLIVCANSYIQFF